MPIGKRRSSNTMLYTLIVFVGLFIVTASVAVIMYLQVEDYRQETDTLREQNNALADSEAWLNIGTIVGSKQSAETYLGKMVSYLDDMVALITGDLPVGSAEAKVSEVNAKFKNIIEVLRTDNAINSTDPNSEGLIWVVEKLKSNLDNTTDSALNLRNQLNELQTRFDDAMAASFEKEQTLLAEKEKYQQQVEEIRKNYGELQDLLKQSTNEQVQGLTAQLEQCQNNQYKLSQSLMTTEAELKITRDRMDLVQSQLETAIGSPDDKVAAYKPDGKIILIDNQTKVVHINLGSKDHVYRGLRFSVYDRYAPIPKDGKGKAEIEVFNVGESISSAQITNPDIKKPIILNDVIINLIWDKDETNIFVVAGEFDFDGDGLAEPDGPEKIKSLINKWGGAVAESVSIETNYVVLGNKPTVLSKPTFEQMGVDPLAEDKYNTSLQRNERYQMAQRLADTLSIPVFNTERFLYLIGYKSQAGRPGAFY